MPFVPGTNFKTQRHHFGRWWLAGCLLLASLFMGGAMLSPSASPAAHRPSKNAAHVPASKNIETIRVGQRVVTQDVSLRSLKEGQEVRATENGATAVDPTTWKKLVLRADWRWADGTHDDINVETLVPPEWIDQHNASIGAAVPLPLDLIEMGLPDDLRAKVLAIESCPPIQSGPGRVVLTTVSHLNPDVLELTFRDSNGRKDKVCPTSFHKFYSETRSDWISAVDLREGEQLRGVNGLLTVAGVSRIPGIHRVYNMTVEDEHVYRVASTGVLVHNNGCKARDSGKNEPHVGQGKVKKAKDNIKQAENDIAEFKRTQRGTEGFKDKLKELQKNLDHWKLKKTGGKEGPHGMRKKG